MPLKHRVPSTNVFVVDEAPERFTAGAVVDWTPARKARPLNDLLASTKRWADSLPTLGRPDALMRMYPRLANSIATAWSDPIAAQAVLDDLLVDRRGGRSGFPMLVRADLMQLRSILYGRM